ncbi:hypothetical protein MKW94_020442 [Papaver nudicaule]|uniref:Exostosin GT47 domain-containing protein n=1 Tax=Papaver nudicaule TaxID=74823 RepID=A0AA41VX75_PAPNU|nr:hypothetical protein [Papaver nudicaule]
MEKSSGTCRHQSWFVIFVSFGLWFTLFYFNSEAFISSKNKVQSVMAAYVYGITSPISMNPIENATDTGIDDDNVENNSVEDPVEPKNEDPNEENGNEPIDQKDLVTAIESESGPDCSGKYIYVHDLPSEFNEDLIKECRTLNKWIEMCPYMVNAGLGPRIGNSQGVFSTKGWFSTNQFMLEVIFHNRMKQYKCLTTDSSKASAVFVPFYAGFEVARYLWDYDVPTRDAASLALVKWLTSKPEWKVLGGRDHFMVAGRITWDFRRLTDKDEDWGNKLMVLPEVRNMSTLTIEASPWHKNDFGVPYPTYFHPSSDSEVLQWQSRMRRQRKRFLFSFVGAPRPGSTKLIRNQLIDQCLVSKKCKLLDCSKGNKKSCDKPSNVMKVFQSSTFCLEPPGDSPTRRSAFDAILAGCIPVFFHPGSAYTQYTWFLPQNYKKYSVYIPEDQVRDGKVNIESVLQRYSKEQVRRMREEVIKLIPRVIYADPRSKLETIEDAFDISIEAVLNRVEKARTDLKEGRNPDEPPHLETNTWKYNLFKTEEKHEWDHFFYD